MLGAFCMYLDSVFCWRFISVSSGRWFLYLVIEPGWTLPLPLRNTYTFICTSFVFALQTPLRVLPHPRGQN